MAKFRLLERGLLDAAQGVDELQIRVKLKKKQAAKKTKKKKGEEESEEESSEDEDGGMAEPDETLDQFAMRINLYVALHLSRSPGSKRDHYKDGLVFKARKDLITEFLKASFTNKCHNDGCGRWVCWSTFEPGLITPSQLWVYFPERRPYQSDRVRSLEETESTAAPETA